MKTLRIISALCLGLFLVMAYGIAEALEDDEIETSVVSLIVPETAQLSIADSASSATLGADGTSETAFDAGEVVLDPATPTLTVSANKAWVLSAKSSGFGASPYGKAVGDLLLKDTSAGVSTVAMSDYTAFITVDADQTVASHDAGVEDESHSCQYKILLDWTQDIPGTYTATVTYTLATGP